MDGRAVVVQESGQECFVAAGAAADLVRRFQERDVQSCLGEQGGGSEPVGTPPTTTADVIGCPST